MTRETHCRECGCELRSLGLRPTAVFCCVEHRKAWNNRRAVRGAELYDLFMANSYERDKRKTLGLLAQMSRLTRAYRDADKALRDGRPSWNAEETIERIPFAFGNDGDKR